MSTKTDTITDEKPASPSAADCSAWKIFHVTDVDEWWIARTAEEAVEDYVKCCGEEWRGELLDPVEEMTDEEMRRFTYYDEEGDRKRSFLCELNSRIKAGLSAPEMFATSEY